MQPPRVVPFPKRERVVVAAGFALSVRSSKLVVPPGRGADTFIENIRAMTAITIAITTPAIVTLLVI